MGEQCTITIWILSVFFVIYGILGLFGIQRVPKKHKGKDYEPEYKRSLSVIYLMAGIPWLILCLLLSVYSISVGKTIIIYITISVPSLVYSILTENNYKNK